MGSLSAMSSLNRVLENHGDEIRNELMETVPPSVRGHLREIVLTNQIHHIASSWLFEDGGLEGPSFQIDELAERFPDCEVGY